MPFNISRSEQLLTPRKKKIKEKPPLEQGRVVVITSSGLNQRFVFTASSLLLFFSSEIFCITIAAMQYAHISGYLWQRGKSPVLEVGFASCTQNWCYLYGMFCMQFINTTYILIKLKSWETFVFKWRHFSCCINLLYYNFQTGAHALLI